VPDHYFDVAHVGTLTDRERAVVHLLSHGYTRAMCAETLHISRHTVKDRLTMARAKMNAKTTEHLVAIAIRQRLIE
jgi:DNA-binding CsgD family transcriptional regulator